MRYPPPMRRVFAFSALPLWWLCSACAPPPAAPTLDDALGYLGVGEGARFVYQSVNGDEQVHEYQRNTNFGERAAFDRIVRRGGFVQDAEVVTLEATLEGFQLVRFRECFAGCETPAEPIPMWSWPIEPGESSASRVALQISTSEGESVRDENHRFQVARESEEVIVPAGTFTGYRVVWTRSFDATVMTREWVFVPEVGVVWLQGDDAVPYAWVGDESP